MKIALVRPNYKSHIITPPLGLGYLSSYLNKYGIETVIIDGLKEGLNARRIIKKILELKPDAVGITCITAFYKEVVLISRELKKNKIITIIGGQHPTFLPYQTLIESQADYVVCGEGEIPLLDLVRNNLRNDNIQGVYSLVNLKDEQNGSLIFYTHNRIDTPDLFQLIHNIQKVGGIVHIQVNVSFEHPVETVEINRTHVHIQTF